jgi:hypothetical protein
MILIWRTSEARWGDHAFAVFSFILDVVVKPNLAAELLWMLASRGRHYLV